MFQIQVCMLQGSVTNIKVIFIMFAGPQFLVWLGLLCGDCFSVNGLLCAQWYLIAWAESLSLECLALVQYIWLCFQFSDFINWIWKHISLKSLTLSTKFHQIHFVVFWSNIERGISFLFYYLGILSESILFILYAIYLFPSVN